MIKITRFFYINILVLPIIVLSFLVGSPVTFFISYGIVLIHELFHLFAALLLQVPVYAIILMPFGMTLRLSSKLRKTPRKEMMIAAAGPFSNGIMLLLGTIFLEQGNLIHLQFMVANAVILLFNLLPIPPLDGGRIFRAFLMHRLGLIPGEKVVRRVSGVLTMLLVAAGIWILIIFRGNISLVIVAAFLCYSFIEEKKNSDILAMGMMIYEKEFLRQGGFIPTKHVTLHKSAPAKMVFRKLNFSSFYLVTVLNDDLSVLTILTESDIIRSITKKGYAVSLEACI